MSPAPPSETTRLGARRPLAVICSRKSRQASIDSVAAPGSTARSTGFPSVVMPQATSTGSASSAPLVAIPAEVLGHLCLEGGLE
jgi:hypothetical protein